MEDKQLIAQDVEGVKAGETVLTSGNKMDQSHSQIFSSSLFAQYDKGVRHSSSKMSDDKALIGYSEQGLPFLLMVDGFYGGETSKTFLFIKNQLLPLLNGYSNALASSNDQTEETRKLIKKIYQLRRQHASVSEFTLGIAVVYEKAGLLFCAGFSIGDIGIVLRQSKSSNIIQLAACTKIDDNKDAFDNYCERKFGLDTVINRNSLFNRHVQAGDEIFGYTYLFETLLETKFTAQNIKQYVLCVDVNRLPADQPLMLFVMSEMNHKFNSLCERAVNEKASTRFGDDCTMSYMLIPDIKLQAKLKLLIHQASTELHEESTSAESGCVLS